MAKAKHMAKKSGAGLRIAGIVAGVLLGLLVIAYLAGAALFSYRFLPNSAIGGVDVSLLPADEAADALQADLDARGVVVTGNDVSFTVMAAQAGMSSNIPKAVDTVLAAQNVWTWPLELMERHDADDAVRSSCDAGVLRLFVTDAIADHNASAPAPVDASIYFDDAIGLYRIDPGDLGGVLDADRVTAKVIAAFGEDAGFAYLTSEELVPQKVAADSLKLLASLDSINSYLGCEVVLAVAGAQIATLDSATVAGWLSLTDNGQAVFDDAALGEWCRGIESLVDDVGSTRSYTRPDGKYVTVAGGSYGWISDREALQAMLMQAITDHTRAQMDVPLKQSAQYFAHGGQEWGSRYIDVDLSEQFVRFYGSDGSIIWSSACISGASPGRDTPTGTWFVNNKQLDQTLVGLDEDHDGEPDYRTPVTYWMPFEGNLVAFHDAPWQPGFGGTMYRDGYGSHGCINLPSDAAASLYSIIQIGDVVVVHY